MDKNFWYIYFYTNFLNNYNKPWERSGHVEKGEDLIKQESVEGIFHFSFVELLPVSLAYPINGHTMFSTQFSISALSIYDIQNTTVLHYKL